MKPNEEGVSGIRSDTLVLRFSNMKVIIDLDDGHFGRMMG